MPITDQILDQLLADCKSPEDLMGEQGLLRQLTKKLAERALEAEMEHHLGYPKTRLQVKIPVIPAMGKRLKPFALFMVNLSWKSPETGIVPLNRNW